MRRASLGRGHTTASGSQTPLLLKRLARRVCLARGLLIPFQGLISCRTGNLTVAARTMKSLQGHLLVASPDMVNSPFSETVILVLQHTDQGAWGVVLNRPAEASIRDLWQQVGDQPCEIDRPVNMGGPISGPVIAVHHCEPLAEAVVPPGVFVASQRDSLEQLVHQTEHPFRLFVGHSGWIAGQLNDELAHGVWLTTPATLEYVFGDEDQLWQQALQAIGRRFTQSLNIKHVPTDVSLN
jgi:putative transcriptional regulator